VVINTVNGMNKAQVTPKYHATETLGKPYQVTRIKNAVVVHLEPLGGLPKDIRVGDRLDERDATNLAAQHEVTVQ